MDAGETRSATADKVARFEFDTDFPPGDVAAYLVETPAPILVDAATPGEETGDSLIDQLEAAGYAPADVEAVVATHPHTDHVGQLSLFREIGVPTYAPRGAIEQVRRDEVDLAAGVREVGRSIGLDAEHLELQVDRACESLTRDRALLDPEYTTAFGFDSPLEVAGRTFEPIHTPGHQAHHAALSTTIGDERALFSGDALIEPFKPATLHVGVDHGAYEATDAFYAAMDRLAERDFDRVYPGHGPVFADAASAIEHTRTRLDDLLADTLSALEAVEPAPPVRIAIERVGEIEHPARLLDTVGALGTLERRGEVVYEEDEGVRIYERA